MKVFVLDIQHEKNKILVYGRDENGKKVCLEYVQDFFIYIIPYPDFFDEVLEKVKNIKYIKGFEVEEKIYIGKNYKVIKVFLSENDYDKIKEFTDNLKSEGKILGKKEGDISIVKKFSLENNVYPLFSYDFDVEFIKQDKNLVYYRIKKVNGKIDDFNYNLKVVSLDIETENYIGFPSPKDHPVRLVSLYDGNKFYTIVYGECSDDCIKVKNEYELFEKLNSIIKEIDPDVIVGYNSNNFDINYLYERSKNIGFQFTFSWNGEGIILTKKRDEDRKYKFVGIQHLDLYEAIVNLFSGQIRTETYTLNEISKEVLGEEKIDFDFSNEDIDFNDKELMKKFIEYNRKDAELTYKLYKYFEGILVELAKITGMTLYEVSNSTYGILVENYLMIKAKQNNNIIPNLPKQDEIRKRMNVKYTGGFVMEPKPGLYNNIAVFDFRSLYPSIILAYNISPDTLNCPHEDCMKESIEIEISSTKKKVWFCKKEKGFISKNIKELFEERAEIKKKLKSIDKNSAEYKILDNKQYALKILINSMYGYLGFPNSRWYCLECAAAVTAYGRSNIKRVIDYLGSKGFKVIYGDTDSVFVEVKDKENSLKVLEEINNNLLKKPLELELEDFYVRGIFVSARSKEGGAKKRYALINDEGKIKLRGFEAVRRDWSKIAKEVQENMIKYVLSGRVDDAINYLRDIIKKVRNRELPIEYFIIKEQLGKNLEEYEVSAPHVIAAKKYISKGYKVKKGFIVNYVVCSGGEKISDKVKLPEDCKDREYDPEYYINRQIFPAIESILDALNISKENIFSSQSSIKKFFK